MRLTSLLAIGVICGAMGAATFAQTAPAVKLPPSPIGQAAIQLGGRWDKAADGGQRYRDGKWVVIDYSRPLLRGRKDIFGAGAEYGKTVSDGSPVWRMGANDTTLLTTQAALTIGGKPLQAGIYNAFAELKPGAWTLVLSTQARQPKFDPNEKVLLYGSYNYDPKYDVLRVPMAVRTGDVSVEQLTLGFVNVTDSSATLTVSWDKTIASVELRLAAGAM